MEANQKILYEHFKKLSKEGINDKIRADAKARATGLLAMYPQFESKVEVKPKETKSDSEEKEKEK